MFLILAVGGWLLAHAGTLKTMLAKGTATLSWDKVEDKGVTDYKIYYGTTPRNADCPPGGYAENQSVGNVSEHTLLNLEPGRTYYFSVTAYNAQKKESCFSEETQKTISQSRFEWVKKLFY